jgi:hypothetical protein
MTNDRKPVRRLLNALGLGLALLAVSNMAVAAKQAHKAKHRWVWSRYGRLYSADEHYGQRAYSISVGNPAFPDRFAHWPNRWND